MKLTLIGMSNIGKTYWSKKLEADGFLCFGCDDIISRKLKIKDVASWMGQPTEEKYYHNSKIYLDFEKKAVEEVIEKIMQFRNGTKVVVDTTGSMIYLDEYLISKLKDCTKFIYLDIPANGIEIMHNKYIQNPKPVYWGPPAALAQCYQDLLNYRLKKYKKYADLSLDYNLLRSNNFSAGDFLKLVGN